MGGKGGGGGGSAPYSEWISHIAANPLTKQGFEDTRKNYATEKEWYAAYGGPQKPSPFVSPDMDKDLFTSLYGSYVEPPAPPAPVAPAPAPPAPAPFVPDPGPALATSPTGPVVGAGGAIPGPTGEGLGDDLGGSVMKPPKYWVGGVNQFKTPTQRTGRDEGALKTTD
jgi:hypothetical protein